MHGEDRSQNCASSPRARRTQDRRSSASCAQREWRAENALRSRPSDEEALKETQLKKLVEKIGGSATRSRRGGLSRGAGCSAGSPRACRKRRGPRRSTLLPSMTKSVPNAHEKLVASFLDLTRRQGVLTLRLGHGDLPADELKHQLTVVLLVNHVWRTKYANIIVTDGGVGRSATPI